MEPALLIALAAVSVLTLHLTADLAFRCVAAIGTSRLGASRCVRFLAVGCTAALVLAGTLRMPASAATPPPMARLTEMVVGHPDPPPMTDHPRDTAAAIEPMSYTVKPGDSLWRIARTVLEARGMPSTGSDVSTFWRSIYEANQELIGSDPNLIYPDQVFVLPGV